MRDFNPDAGRSFAQTVRRGSRAGRPSGGGFHRSWRLLSVARAGLLIGAVAAVFIAWAIAARSLAPMANTARQTFDTIIVLGSPADSDGNPTPAMLGRTTEGVREYQRGIASHLIFTGGAAHNRFVEAQVMARVAQAQGVPASVIVVEPEAQDTIQNECFATRIMRARGWRSAEIVSNQAHLPRAAMILQNLPNLRIEWQMHAAPDPIAGGFYRGAANVVETIKTARYLAWTRWTERCGP